MKNDTTHQENKLDDLAKAREEIDILDSEMAELFEKRMHICKKVVAYKKRTGKAIFDPERENKIIEKSLERIKDETLRESYEEFVKNLMNISKAYQKRAIGRISVGYQGAQGAFSHIAAEKIFDGYDTENVVFPTFEEVFMGVANAEVTVGVIPFENSYTGEVGEVFDLLLKYDCTINKIYDLPVHQNLLGVKGSSISSIKQVFSHQQALDQSAEFIKNHGYQSSAYANTALAAKYVSSCEDISKGAIASEETAEIFGLDIVASNINTSNGNTTRFIVIGKNKTFSGNRFSLMFTLDHKTGQLAAVIVEIAKAGFNLQSIKSRPLKNKPWQYYFYIEVDGVLQGEKAAILLEKLKEKCLYVKILGSYD